MVEKRAVTLRIERTFDATLERVWAAWTEPEQIARWWNPSPRATATVHEVDPRVGGRFRLTMHVPEALELAGTDEFPVVGTYVRVEPPRALDIRMLSDPSGDGEILVEVRFEADGARTRMTFKVLGDPGEGYREGMEEGWTTCFDHLDRHLARSADAA